MSLPFDDTDMEPLPASFLARLQPAGAFLQTNEAPAHSLQSPTALAQRRGGLTTPAMAPLKPHTALKPKSAASADGAVAMSFMSAMRRGLHTASDSEDEEEDEGEDGGYYQPAYSQYHAPTASFTGRASGLLVQPPAHDDEELIFPMEL
jgi:hypothetical protein